MSTTQSTPNVISKPLVGKLFLKQEVTLTPAADGTERKMGVLHIESDKGVIRVTDFSRQHQNLVEGESIKLVYEESEQVKDGRHVTYRNLQTAVQ